MKIKSLVEAYVEKFAKKQKDSGESKKISPEVKANGERAKVKSSR